MNWPFIIAWLLIFIGIILAFAVIGNIYDLLIIGVIVGVICDIVIVAFYIARTPWF